LILFGRTLVTVGGGREADVNHDGHLDILGSHIYSLIGAAEAEGHRLVKVWNPYGGEEWHGAWGDGDSRWTKALRQSVGKVDEEDGN